jgi:hypothetical protein
MNTSFVQRGEFLDYLRNSLRPRSINRRPTAARLLGLRFRIPPGARMSVSGEFRVLSGTGLCDGPITRPKCPTECGVSECDIVTPTIKWPRPW